MLIFVFFIKIYLKKYSLKNRAIEKNAFIYLGEYLFTDSQLFWFLILWNNVYLGPQIVNMYEGKLFEQ